MARAYVRGPWALTVAQEAAGGTGSTVQKLQKTVEALCVCVSTAPC